MAYDLEYGADVLEIHTDAIAPKARVLVVHDLLATGGTVEACCRLVEKLGGIVVGCVPDRTGRPALRGESRSTKRSAWSSMSDMLQRVQLVLDARAADIGERELID